METNEYQIGGNHYAGDYQHWDWVVDNEMNYLLGCATKYIIRWRKKNGLEDLRKAIHYITKAEENNCFFWNLNIHRKLMFSKKKYADFYKNINFTEKNVIDAILENNLPRANMLISRMILDEETEPTLNYTNQDGDEK